MFALQLLAKDVGIPAVAEEPRAQPVIETVERRLAPRLAEGRGARHEALQAVSTAVRQQFDHLGRDGAYGFELRHNHGSAFIAEEFHSQIEA